MKNYIIFTESNDNEGETWRFFIPYNTEEDKKCVALLQEKLEAVAAEDGYDVDDMYSFDESVLIPENEIDIVVKHTKRIGGYMDLFTKVERSLDFEKIEKTKFNIDTLYKGAIYNFTK